MTKHRRIPIWLKLFIGLVILVGLFASTFLAYLVVSLSGGIDDVFNGSKPSENDQKVIQARTSAEPKLRESRNEALTAFDLPRTQGRLLAEGEGRYCEHGQHNWKVDDPYDLSCTLVATYVVAAPKATFRQNILLFHHQLDALDWRGTFDLATVMSRHQDNEQIPNPRLPDASYSRTHNGNNEGLQVAWIENQVFDSQFSYAEVLAKIVYTWNGRQVSTAEIRDSVRPNEYGMTISLSLDYFEE